MEPTKNPELILPTNDQASVEMRALTQEVSTTAVKFSVATIDDRSRAIALLADAKQRSKAIEERREKMKRPAIEAGREIDRFFSELQEPLKTGIRALERGIASFDQEQARLARLAQEQEEKRRREEQEKLDAERRAAEKLAVDAAAAAAKIEADDFAAQIKADREQQAAAQLVREANEKAAGAAAAPVARFVPPPTTAKVATSSGGVASVGVKTVTKIRVIPGQEHLVPRQYCDPTQSKLNAAVKLDPKVSIPGCETYEDVQSRVS